MWPHPGWGAQWQLEDSRRMRDLHSFSRLVELSYPNPGLESSSKKGATSRNQAGVLRSFSKTSEITERDYSKRGFLKPEAHGSLRVRIWDLDKTHIWADCCQMAKLFSYALPFVWCCTTKQMRFLYEEYFKKFFFSLGIFKAFFLFLLNTRTYEFCCSW